MQPDLRTSRVRVAGAVTATFVLLAAGAAASHSVTEVRSSLSISAGFNHACALTATGEPYC